MEPSPDKPPVQPQPYYGSLGPNSDIGSNKPITPQAGNQRIVAAIAVGALLAAFLSGAKAKGFWDVVGGVITNLSKPRVTTGATTTQAQAEAEDLLSKAVGHDQAAGATITAEADNWRGRIQLTPRLNSLVTTALNSDDRHVREIGIEVDLAAVDSSKTTGTADSLMQQAATAAISRRIWALWTLGLLANRGVETERVTQFLIDQLKSPKPEIRQWTVEGLSYVGTDQTIPPLLKTLHDDSSPTVRERAACALAQSGMLTPEQRQTAVPELLQYADDGSLDAPTHAWVYHALRDITGQTLPDDAAAWKAWYSASHS